MWLPSLYIRVGYYLEDIYGDSFSIDVLIYEFYVNPLMTNFLRQGALDRLLLKFLFCIFLDFRSVKCYLYKRARKDPSPPSFVVKSEKLNTNLISNG